MRPLVGVRRLVPGRATCDHGPNHAYMKTPDAETSSQPVLVVSVAMLLILERRGIGSLHWQSIYRTLCRQKDTGYFGWAFLHDPGPKHSTCSRSWYQQHQPGTSPCCSYSLFEAHPFWTSDSEELRQTIWTRHLPLSGVHRHCQWNHSMKLETPKRTDFLLWLIRTGRDASFWPRFQRIYVDVHGTFVHRRSHICLAELSGHVREAIVWPH